MGSPQSIIPCVARHGLEEDFLRITRKHWIAQGADQGGFLPNGKVGSWLGTPSKPRG
jgi:hypothetical protein